MGERNIYLKIEVIHNYSPVEPDDKAPPPIEYRRDCMRNMGHLDGKIPMSERNARALDAVVYREYIDPGYILPKTVKLISNDINEPVYDHRVPGTVIYARPGDILHIEVFNCDNEPHSWHIHGVDYGINSDGAWPFGVQAIDGRRSDEICPGQKWIYTIRVTDDSVGCWPFHSHTRNTGVSVNRGLFGGLVVLSKKVHLPHDIMIPPNLAALPKELAIREGRKVVMAAALSKANRQYLHDQLDFLKEWVEAQTFAENQLFMDEDTNVDLAVRLGKDCKLDFLNADEVITAIDHLVEKSEVLSISEAIVKNKHVDSLTILPLFRPIHAPIFLHIMIDPDADPIFDSGDLEELVGVFDQQFNVVGDFEYFCQFHPAMNGTVKVVPGGPANATVSIGDGPPMGFSPNEVNIGVGGIVRWENHSMMHHTVTSVDGGAMQSHCLNGRAFTGNSPTIVGFSGQTIRWYVFNLDFGHEFHNFHTHSMRWKNGIENQDTRVLSPAESFCVNTKIPQVIIPNGDLLKLQKTWPKPKDARLYLVKGDFVFHCHVHHHMMNGMVGIVRARQFVWLTDCLKEELEANGSILPYDNTNACPGIDLNRCKKLGEGKWEEIIGDPEVTMMHSMPLPNTNKMLYWGYTNIEQSRLFDWTSDIYSKPANQPAALPGHDQFTSNLWSSEHTFLDEASGTLIAHGGLTAGQTKSFLFDPPTETWSATADTSDARFYSTTLTLANGRALTLYGTGSKSIEVYDPTVGTWSAPIIMPAAMDHHVYYPWTYLLPDGKLFIAGPHDPTHRFDWNNAAATLETFPTKYGNRSTSGEKGTSTMFILRPPDYSVRILIAGGNTPTTEQTAEIIDLSQPVPVWTAIPKLINVSRPYQLQTTLLPDGRVVLAGGATPGPDGGPIEIYDPKVPEQGWVQGPIMKYVRGYHSSMVMMPDGSIICGGDPQVGGNPTNHERYKPGYFTATRPTIMNAPSTVSYSASFTIDTPDASNIAEVILMYPGSVTHGFNMTQRGVECVITGGTLATIDTTAPPDGNIAPPGWWILFILDSNRRPSLGRWIRLT